MFTQIKSALGAARARGQARRNYQRLLEADEHLLRDIGVSRIDVRHAMARSRRDV